MGGPTKEMAEAKGFEVKTIQSNGWYHALKSAGVPTVFDVVDDVNDKGHQIMDPTTTMICNRDRVWAWLEDVQLTKGKVKPEVKSYKVIMDGGKIRAGYYDPETKCILIHVDYAEQLSTYLEELAHYITGSTDMSRDLQNYAFQGWSDTAVLAGG